MTNINENNSDRDILEAIRDKNISPKPKWRFLLKDYVVWISAVVCLLIGGVAVSLVIYMLEFNGWEAYRRLEQGPAQFLLMGVPIFWILLLIVFLAVVYYNFKHTKRGYRYSTLTILIGLLALSVILGVFFHTTGLGRKIDFALGRAPFYDRMINPHMGFWSSPESGRLSGLVISAEQDELRMLDRSRNEWRVHIGDARKDGRGFIAEGKPAIFIGKLISEREFNATFMLPMEPGEGFFARPMQGMPPFDIHSPARPQ